ncbi:MAG: KpsF/GutQ family sugar-phosphate isomerase [Chitinophagales bacterium]|nr:KpsF/GutQ family sugar-phosphate isomerase [Hyphomicrobiales bacterium]
MHSASVAGASKSLGGQMRAAESAGRTLALEIRGLQAVEAAIANGSQQSFAAAVQTIQSSNGRVIVSGMGKSGHIGQKIAATLASTGTPAFFVHPGEASHGDLGMIAKDDVILALSWSGETVELANVITYSRRFGVALIAITSQASSALGKAADIVLELPRMEEACPHGLAPTTSTIMQLGLGDALAIALLESRGFSANDFKTFHPGGKLGANLRLVRDLMHSGDGLPVASENAAMSHALVVMTEKSLGCLGVLDAQGALCGILTDGDLRRHMGPGLLERRAGDVMTRNPKTISPDLLASAAMQILNEARITALFVVENGKPVGIVHVHDLLRAGVA